MRNLSTVMGQCLAKVPKDNSNYEALQAEISKIKDSIPTRPQRQWGYVGLGSATRSIIYSPEINTPWLKEIQTLLREHQNP